MKRILSILLLVVYLVVISGIALQLHYCGGKLSSVKITLLDNEHTCTCKSKKMRKGCCKTHSIYLKVKGDQKVSNSTTPVFKGLHKAISNLPTAKLNLLPSYAVVVINNYHAPPPRSGNPLLIYNNTFRI